MKKILLVASTFFVLGACNNDKGWSKSNKDGFMDVCVQGATSSMGEVKAKNYCSCMLDKVEKEYPNANDAGQFENNPRKTEMAKDCLGMK
jgi:hypothetical protein